MSVLIIIPTSQSSGIFFKIIKKRLYVLVKKLAASCSKLGLDKKLIERLGEKYKFYFSDSMKEDISTKELRFFRTEISKNKCEQTFFFVSFTKENSLPRNAENIWDVQIGYWINLEGKKKKRKEIHYFGIKKTFSGKTKKNQK